MITPTDLPPYGSRYLDGWADACADMRRQLAADPCCPHHAVDRVMFAGIAAAAIIDATPGSVRPEVVTTAAERLVMTALEPRLEDRAALVEQARYLVRNEPNIAADVLTQVTLLAAKRYTAEVYDDGTVVPVTTAAEW